jgi:hypothetical protein
MFAQSNPGGHGRGVQAKVSQSYWDEPPENRGRFVTACRLRRAQAFALIAPRDNRLAIGARAEASSLSVRSRALSSSLAVHGSSILKAEFHWRRTDLVMRV